MMRICYPLVNRSRPTSASGWNPNCARQSSGRLERFAELCPLAGEGRKPTRSARPLPHRPSLRKGKGGAVGQDWHFARSLPRGKLRFSWALRGISAPSFCPAGQPGQNGAVCPGKRGKVFQKYRRGTKSPFSLFFAVICQVSSVRSNSLSFARLVSLRSTADFGMPVASA